MNLGSNFSDYRCYLYKCVWSRFKSSNRMLSFMCGCMILCVQSSWLYMKSIRLFLFFWSFFLFNSIPSMFYFCLFSILCSKRYFFLFEPKRYSSQINMKCFNSLEKKNYESEKKFQNYNCKWIWLFIQTWSTFKFKFRTRIIVRIEHLKSN